MTWTYVFCLVAGGILIALSIAGDADGELGGNGDAITEGGNPTVLFSTSFWSFALAGFGLSGFLLEVVQSSTPSLLTFPLALLIGVGLGWAAAFSLRILARRDANTLVRSDDLIGREATVTLPLTTEQRGFVELSVKGSLLRRVALGNSQPLGKGKNVVVLRTEGTTLIVEALDVAG